MIVVAGTHSGSGKTTVTLGLMAALRRRGMEVQGYKVGPDFIDPGHHRAVTGRDSHNLDGWMIDRDTNQALFLSGLQGADAGIIEGVMGLFDGFSGADESGSTAQMAKWLGAPPLLVIDARSMARSAAAVALGFAGFDRDLRLAGAVFNRVGSEAHGRMLKEAMAGVPGVPVLGCLPRDEELSIPSRHLGLVTAEDSATGPEEIERLGGWIQSHMDLDRLLAEAPLAEAKSREAPAAEATERAVIGVARDEAFCFYYAENLRLLRAAGAELIPFSPLRDKALPEGVQGLYLGGGYPELHCEALSANRRMRKEILEFASARRPVYAECGGFMYLMRSIRDLKGRSHRMAGVFPFEAAIEPRLRALGYREVTTRRESLLGPAGIRVRGHEFHYSRPMTARGEGSELIYRMTGREGSGPEEEGFAFERTLGSYVHLHWGSNPDVPGWFVAACKEAP